MKLRTLKLTPEELLRALQGKPSTLNLPVDLELLDIKYDAFARQVSAVVRSDSFEDIAESIPIPDFGSNESTSVQKAPIPLIAPKVSTPAIMQPTMISSVGVKTLEAKPTVKTEASQDTGGFEEEFTKEQRKVLRFSVDGDNVIVKPTQFLKTEWDDINDTVKSIGGQWVKGAVIPCWSIPKNQKPE